jgi:Leucine-rich repeat (LRR) protein
LKSLSLVGNKLSTLPDYVSRLTNLESLKLNMNEIDTFSVNIFLLPHIQDIGIALNQITHTTQLTQEVSRPSDSEAVDRQPISLQQLYMEENKLDILDFLTQIGNRMQALITLKLSYNRITKIPREIGYLHGVELLDLNYNKLKSRMQVAMISD